MIRATHVQRHLTINRLALRELEQEVHLLRRQVKDLEANRPDVNRVAALTAAPPRLAPPAAAAPATPSLRAPARLWGHLAALILVLLIVLLGFPSGRLESPEAAWPSPALQSLKRVRIEWDGRVTSLDAYARTFLGFVTGAPQLGRQDPVQTVLSMAASPERWRDVPLLAVPSSELQERLGFTTERVSLSQLVQRRQTVRQLLVVALGRYSRGEPLTSADQELVALAARWARLDAVLRQDLPVVGPPPSAGKAPAWLSILDPDGYAPDQQIGVKRTWGAFIGAVRRGYPPSIEEAAGRLASALGNLNSHTSGSSSLVLAQRY